MARRIGGESIMAKQYARPLVPSEFMGWVEERRKALENMARKARRKKPVTQMEAMRIISQTGAVNIPDEIFRKMMGQHRC